MTTFALLTLLVPVSFASTCPVPKRYQTPIHNPMSNHLQSAVPKYGAFVVLGHQGLATRVGSEEEAQNYITCIIEELPPTASGYHTPV